MRARQACAVAIEAWLTVTLSSCGVGGREGAEDRAADQADDPGAATGYPLISNERLRLFTADSAKLQQVSVRADTAFVVGGSGRGIVMQPIGAIDLPLEAGDFVVLAPVGERTLVVKATAGSRAAGCLDLAQMREHPDDVRVARLYWGRLVPVLEDGFERQVVDTLAAQAIFPRGNLLPFVLHAAPGGDCTQAE